ncbi:D-alanine--D-alanine ligase family protein [Chrysiogenes arsenatis]|uniref:D-alanine--D-alanine ligase family protein n=1 Tax=Chrysiogenes arsenatis TaxID=309797 RepID=UPI00041B47D2|nr:D-alanine--D-alanine ligase [Chrysiogenes arsenatis]
MSVPSEVTVGLLMGGNSHEREVSLRSGAGIAQALREYNYRVIELDPSDPFFSSKLESIDIAYNTLHGSIGENGVIQGYFDMLGIPYTGTGVMGSGVSMDKDISKKVAIGCGMSTPNYFVYYQEQRDCHALPNTSPLGYPVVVKAACQGSSIGVEIVENDAQFQRAMDICFELDRKVLVEAYVKGYEVTVGFIGRTALPPVGIVPHERFYNYEAKYSQGKTQYDVPAQISSELCCSIQGQSQKLRRALDLQGCFRVDFIIVDEVAYFLEINTNPGMTATSLIPKAAGLAGISYAELVHRNILETLNKRGC